MWFSSDSDRFHRQLKWSCNMWTVAAVKHVSKNSLKWYFTFHSARYCTTYTRYTLRSTGVNRLYSLMIFCYTGEEINSIAKWSESHPNITYLNWTSQDRTRPLKDIILNIYQQRCVALLFKLQKLFLFLKSKRTDQMFEYSDSYAGILTSSFSHPWTIYKAAGSHNPMRKLIWRHMAASNASKRFSSNKAVVAAGQFN